MADSNLRTAAYKTISLIYDKLQARKFGTEDAVYAEQMLHTLRSHWNTFMDKNNKLIAKAKEDEVDTHVALGLEAEELYNECCVLLKSCGSSVTPTMPTNQLQLDPLSIPSFDGQMHNWLAFKDAFETLVHNADLPEAYKLGKLRQAVKATEVPLVGGVYSGGYNDVWAALKARYDNRKQLAEIHVNKFLSIKSAQEESHKSLLTIVDEVATCIRALRVMGLPVERWDAITVPIIVSKLPSTTRRGWCMSTSATEIPSLSELLKFLEQRAQSLAGSTAALSRGCNRDKGQTAVKSLVSSAASDGKCAYCGNEHRIYNCSILLAMQPQQRFEAVKSKSLCFNCLRTGHSANQCKSGGCRHCSRKHNTIICRTKPSVSENTQPVPIKEESTQAASAPCTYLATSAQTVLLATARVWAYDVYGELKLIRVLCDPGSQISFVTERLVNWLRLTRRKQELSIEGIGTATHVRSMGSTTLKLQSTYSDFVVKVNASIIPVIVSRIPSTDVNMEQWPYLTDIPLADPHFGTPDGIDALLGADIWGQIIQDSTLHGKGSEPHAQNTHFGWVVFGSATTSSHSIISCMATAKSTGPDRDLEDILMNFWKLEEVPDYDTKSGGDCERIFKETHARTDAGRYVVQIPLKAEIGRLGDSYENALRQFGYLERRLSGNASIRSQYIQFMREYLELGHMVEVADPIVSNDCYYIPHHAVTAKFRVVFNASAPTTSGLSLNDIQLVGPTIQDSLIHIIFRFRKYRIAVTADVEKMFRQVLVSEEHRDLQRILWREAPTDKLKVYQLTTVTYGMASSPFNAVRALQQCAFDNFRMVEELESATLARESIVSSFYVDDWLTSCSTVDKAWRLAHDVDTILRAGHFKLRKWSSNDAHLTSRLNGTSLPSDGWNFNPPITSVLGLHWNPGTDELVYTFELTEIPTLWTKRRALSKLAQLFDPIGLLSPVIIRGKIFIQRLWASGTGWDAPLSSELLEPWLTFCESLRALNHISIPRWLGMAEGGASCIHGFCDASLRAYAAVIYLQTEIEGRSSSILITSRTKVAPLKGSTIPRLELCAAQLLASTLQSVRIALGLADMPYYLWTDSQVVLCWLRKQPTLLKQYVSNRVRYIQENTQTSAWHYIRSADNPADCASRGISPKELAEHPLWWHGPSWLGDYVQSLQNNCDSLTREEQQLMQEEEKPIVLVASPTSTFPITMRLSSGSEISILDRYSNINRLLNMTAYILRWVPHKSQKAKQRPDGQELTHALNFLISMDQGLYFKIDITHIRSHSRLPSLSRLLPLNPFIGTDGLLRVGGRINRANLSFENQFPIILAKASPLTRLIIQRAHIDTQHGGAQLMLRVLRSKYWILQGRQLVRSFIHSCVVCRRHRGATLTQQMAPLPSHRVNACRPFLATGVDYCGPFTLRVGNKRSRTTTKTYLAIFVCMATKAVHIEVVEDLSAPAFLDAYTRFISRRGPCGTLYSDNATTFVGANRILKEDLAAWHNDFNQQAIAHMGTTWRFKSPRAPHQGGLWEAAVKSAKRHLIRVVGAQTMWYGQLQTLATRIEACLNSRPIIPLTDDPDDKYVLTPGDFLIGAPLLAVPEPSVMDIPANRVKHWQFLRQLHQEFWRRWSEDYLSTLQTRGKWQRPTDLIQVGDIVLVKDENLPPTHWRMGRVIAVHPGSDNLVRNVTLKTSGGELVRAVQKLCPLLEPTRFEPFRSTGQDVQNL